MTFDLFAYYRRHKRSIILFVALLLVVSSASQIEDLFHGLLS